MTTDKTGAPTTVTQRDAEFTIAVDGQTVGSAAFADRGNRCLDERLPSQAK